MKLYELFEYLIEEVQNFVNIIDSYSKDTKLSEVEKYFVDLRSVLLKVRESDVFRKGAIS